jgi:DNA-binding transcriptional regulator YiaG
MAACMSPDDVKALRERMQLGRAEFAARIPVDKRTVRRWENNEVAPSPLAAQMLQRLLEALESPESSATRRRALPDVV